jgi:hypothetical protein
MSMFSSGRVRVRACRRRILRIEWSCDCGGGVRIDDSGRFNRLCTANRCVRVIRTLLSDRWFGRHCYVEPVYTLDADLVVIAGSLPALTAHLEAHGFRTDVQKHSVKAQAPGSELRIQFTTDGRYQAFPARSVEATVLEIRVKVACREDVTQGKLWAYGDPHQRLSKRKKDELDLIRLAEAYPELKSPQ